MILLKLILLFSTGFTQTLTIKQAVRLSLENNSDFKVAREKLVEAESAKSLAISKAFPTLAANITANELKSASNGQFILFNGQPYSQYKLDLNLTQPLYAGGSLSAGIGYSNKEIEIRKLDLSIVERDTITNVLQSYYLILLHQRQADLLRQVEGVMKQALSITERYFKIGRGQRTDVLHIKSQLALLAPKIIQADNKVKSAATQLGVLLGSENLAPLKISGTLAPVDRNILNTKINVQNTTVPELERAKRLLIQFDDKRTVEMAKHYPSLNAVGTIGRSSYTRPELFEDSGSSWSFGLQLSIPLFSGLSSFRERSVQAAQEKQLEYNAKKITDQSKANQIQSEKDLEVAEKMLIGATSAAKFSQLALKEAERQFRLQITDYLHLINAEQNFLDTATAYNQAKYDYILAIAKYFSVTGISLTEFIDILENNRNKEEI